MHKLYLMIQQDPWLLEGALIYGIPWLIGLLVLGEGIIFFALRWLYGKKISDYEWVKELKAEIIRIEKRARCRI